MWKFVILYYGEGSRLLYESDPWEDYPEDDTIRITLNSIVASPVRKLVKYAKVEKRMYFNTGGM